VLSASVTVDQEVVSSIGKGILVFAAVAPGDTDKEITTIANKVLKMKLWDDEAGAKVISDPLPPFQDVCGVRSRLLLLLIMAFDSPRNSGKRM
jgi:D-tyrosyl-tRNA(Tyr) deacylase